MMHRPQPTVATTAPSRTQVWSRSVRRSLPSPSQRAAPVTPASPRRPRASLPPARRRAPPRRRRRLRRPPRICGSSRLGVARTRSRPSPFAFHSPGPRPRDERGFRYILGGRLTRVGSARLTFHGLAAGHQHLVVALASRRSVKASVSFTVIAPPPPASAPAMSAPASTAAPAPMTPPSTMQAAPAPMTPPSTMHAASGGSGT